MILGQNCRKLQRMRTLLLLHWAYCSLGSQLAGHAHGFSHSVCCASEDLQHCVIAWNLVDGGSTEDLTARTRRIGNGQMQESNNHESEDAKRNEESSEKRV